MSEIISKELLSEVLGGEVVSFEIKDNDVECFAKGLPFDIHINIYELAYRCKEWAFDKGYEIVESHFMIRIKRLSTGETKTYEYTEDEQNEEITFKPEYTFKCCEWILKEIK